MSFGSLIVKNIEGDFSFSKEELPLRVGTGNECQIRLPGPGGEAVAMLDLLDGTPIVQPFGQVVNLFINDVPLEASRRLIDGDILKFFGSEIHVSIVEQDVTIDIRLEDSAYVTQPPECADESDHTNNENIAPIAFQRAATKGNQSPIFKRNQLKIIIGSVLVFLLSISYLLFTSSSVNFEIEPTSPDGFNIDGGWFHLPIGERVLLRKGNYVVHIEKQGYYDISQTFVVGDESSMTVQLEMRKKPGHMIVTTKPAMDALITVDDQLIGKAPFGPIELEPGPHTLRIESDRFLPFNDIVDVTGLDQLERLYVQLTPKWADIEVRSQPSGAMIFSGSNEIGVTPKTIELLEGEHELTIVKEGFNAWDGNIVAVANVAQTLPMVRLLPADAKLLVNTIPRGANVTVNGRYRGQSPLALSLIPDIDYQIGMSKAGYGLTSRSLRLQSAASESITVDLSARVGTVTLDVSPADAIVYVDGRARGTGKTVVRLSSAPHEIEVKRQGFRDWSATVTPRPGYPQTLSVRLRSFESIANDAVVRTTKSVAGQTMRRVESGTFFMGASRAENGRRANEVIRPVTITSPFLISVNEVTNKEFAEFRKNHDSGADVHASLAADNNPVANVTWSDVVQYCNWLSKKEGLTPVYKKEFDHWVPIYPLADGYRLPTEAEWVWAIRYAELSAPSKYPWGKSWPPKKESGNFADETSRGLVPSIIPNFNDGYASTAPVASFKANRIGVFDGGGNVAEWVNDWYTVPTPGIKEPIIDPMGPQNGVSRVIRGSSWKHAGFTEMRLSYRDYGVDARTDLGFRIARNID